jgi:hypothetical protein
MKLLYIVAALSLSLAGCASPAATSQPIEASPIQSSTEGVPSPQIAVQSPTAEPAPAPAPAPVVEPVVPAPAPETVSQRNALKKAETYLKYTAFSRTGLIEQLESEKFTTADATWAVDRVTVDWNEQAAKKADIYLKYSSFSRGSLLEQLASEGFTPEQAEYGVSKTGL